MKYVLMFFEHAVPHHIHYNPQVTHRKNEAEERVRRCA